MKLDGNTSGDPWWYGQRPAERVKRRGNCPHATRMRLRRVPTSALYRGMPKDIIRQLRRQRGRHDRAWTLVKGQRMVDRLKAMNVTQTI